MAKTSEIIAPVSKWFIARYTLANVGLWMALLAPVVIGLQLKLLSISGSQEEAAGSLALVAGVGALLAMAANPIFGRLSDRTTLRAGRRRPWIIVGTLLSLAGLTFIGVASTVWEVLLGWCLVQITFNAALSALRALIADLVPVKQRGTVSGFMGAATGIGTLFAALSVNLVSSMPFWVMVFPGIIGTVLILQFIFGLKERQLKKSEVPPFKLSQILGSLWVNPLKHPDFGWAWISRFLVFIGVATVITYQAFYIINRFGFTPEGAAGTVTVTLGISTLVLVAASFLGGWLSDKFRRRKLFVFLSSLVMVGALYMLATATDISTLYFASALIGLAQGAYAAVDLALVADVLPNKKDSAKDLGVFNIADALPQSIAPAIAPIFLAINGPNNYESLYIAIAVIAIVGALAILPVRGVK
jgi:MFS family permease